MTANESLHCAAWVLSLAAATQLGCSPNRGADPFIVRDSSGVRIAESTMPAWPGGLLWQVSTAPSLSIGAVHGRPEFEFNGIVDVARLPDGRIVAADRASKQVRIFDSSGQHVLSIGREGAGPGEFRDIQGMVIAQDALIVFDGLAHRLSFFRLSGELVRTRAVEISPGANLAFYRLKGVIGSDLVFQPRGAGRPPQGTHWIANPVLRYSWDGNFIGSIAEPMGMDVHYSPPRSAAITFGRFSSGDVQHGFVYVTDGAGMEVRAYDAHRLTAIHRINREPRPVTKAYVERYLEALGPLRGFLEDWPRAETLPWIGGVVVDSDGHIWAQEYKPPYFREPSDWAVFRSDGRWLGSVRLPHNFTPHQIGPTGMLGVYRDSVGVEYVQEFRIDACAGESDRRCAPSNR